jgi:hypothetical protein
MKGFGVVYVSVRDRPLFEKSEFGRVSEGHIRNLKTFCQCKKFNALYIENRIINPVFFAPTVCIGLHIFHRPIFIILAY